MDEPDALAAFEASLTGRSCVVRRREHDWLLDLADGVRIAVAVPWRIVSEGRIAFASNDDGQWFGRSAPVDGEAEANRHLRDKSIVSASVDRQTADLTLQFDQATRIDIFNHSVGYEGWSARCVLDDRVRSVFALGGGEIALLDETAPQRE